ncbi:MAG TPA: FHA domain-containing protein [Kofleriaceae bacterium]|jgi:pSer/pThr/pTyr-binding forkhead associated (FHA) protein/ribosomal protein L40E
MDVGLVCDACSALTPIGVPQCTRCGAAVALDPRPKAKSKPPPMDAPCTKCGAQLIPGQRFCANCGARVPQFANFEGMETRVGPRASAAVPVQAPASGSGPSPELDTQNRRRDGKPGRSTLFFGGAVQSARAKLTLIRGDGEDGVSFTLAGQDHLAGRGDCPISFPDDPFLSPTHANFIYQNGQLTVRDVGSLNGIYVRITGPTELPAGSTILVGEQVLAVRPAAVPEDLPDGDGTYYSASMPRGATLDVLQQLRGGQSGWVFRLSTETVSVGREGNDINFPDDPFISGRHAELRIAGDVLSVTDLGSRNGTFVRVDHERVLRHGDYVFLGQQLLRVEIV